MADVTKETIEHLATLCRIHMTDEDLDQMQNDLEKILQHVEQLQEIDTDDVPPCNQVIPSLHSVMRKDVIGATLSRDEFLENSPDHDGGMIRVPPVMTKQA